MANDINELYQRLILEHNKTPRNFGQLPNPTRVGEGHNPACGDRFKVFVALENDVIRDISFHGAGCALSKASASLMTEAVKGKTVSEARQLAEAFHNAVQTGAGEQARLGDLSVFTVVRRFPMRAKCALLPWQGLSAALTPPA